MTFYKKRDQIVIDNPASEEVVQKSVEAPPKHHGCNDLLLQLESARDGEKDIRFIREKKEKRLEKRDWIYCDLDGGISSLDQWTYNWNGNAIWDKGSVNVDWTYQAKLSFGKATQKYVVRKRISLKWRSLVFRKKM